MKQHINEYILYLYTNKTRRDKPKKKQKNHHILLLFV